MSDDIVDRLRYRAEEIGRGEMPYGLLIDAAKAIEWLRKELEAAKAELAERKPVDE